MSEASDENEEADEDAASSGGSRGGATKAEALGLEDDKFDLVVVDEDVDDSGVALVLAVVVFKEIIGGGCGGGFFDLSIVGVFRFMEPI